MIKTKIISILVLLGVTTVLLTGCPGDQTAAEDTRDVTRAESIVDTCSDTTGTDPIRDTTAEKPVIYLYPDKTEKISVSLTVAGRLSCSYPDYGNGWTVVAQPDGTLTNLADGKEYSYLYWESTSGTQYDFSKGFVIKGEDTASFLQDKLSGLGLTPKEYNEFIVYWLPRMQDNAYNLIAFQGASYTDSAVLSIVPKPDSMLRVFMAYKPLTTFVEVEPQVISEFHREGFTVVEWGGSCVE